MIRETARDWLARRRIYALPMVLTGLGLLGLVGDNGPLFRIFCAVVVVVGAALFVAFRQQEVLRRSGEAQGVVEIDEARITYLSAQGGQIVDRDGLWAVTLLIKPTGAVWVLDHESGPFLEVPLSARGAEGLAALIEALPGVALAQARAALEAGTPGAHLVWQGGR